LRLARKMPAASIVAVEDCRDVWERGLLKLRFFRGYQGDRPAVVFFPHVGLEVGGGEVGRFLLFEDPVTTKTVGDSGEDGVQVERTGVAQAAGVVVAGGVEAAVQAGLDPPVIDVRFQPLLRREFAGGPAGQQADRLGRLIGALAQDPGGLGGEGMADLFAVDFGADERAYHGFSLLAAFFSVTMREA
jgi:hypothetical protein